MLRLFPPPAIEVDVVDAYDVPRSAPEGRPWISLCMIASIDGSTVIGGRSGALGNANDSAILRTMRQLADVVVVGAGTVRAEGYGPPRKAGQRVGVVTNTGRVDPASALFTSGAGFLIVPESAPDAGVETLRAGRDGSVDLVEAFARLHEIVPGVAVVQAEGGPGLNGSMLEDGLLDELVITTAPKMVGGGGPRLTTGAADVATAYDLAHVLVDDESFVFSRWVRRRAC